MVSGIPVTTPEDQAAAIKRKPGATSTSDVDGAAGARPTEQASIEDESFPGYLPPDTNEDENLRGIGAAAFNIGAIDAGALKKMVAWDHLKTSTKNGADMLDNFKKIMDQAVPFENSDIVKELTRNILDGKIKASPDLLNWILAHPPQTLQKPTPRSMAFETAAQVLLSGISGMAQSFGGEGVSAAPVSVGAQVLGAGMQEINAQLLADKQLEDTVMSKNAEIFNKYRDDVIAAWKEVDNNSSEREKAFIQLWLGARSDDVKKYEIDVKKRSDELAATRGLAEEFSKEAASGYQKLAELQSGEYQTEYIQRETTKRANQANQLTGMRIYLGAQKARQEQKINLSDSEIKNYSVTASWLTKYGANGQAMRNAMYTLNDMARDSFERNAQPAQGYGQQLAQSIQEFARKSAGLFTNNKKEVINVINSALNANAYGIIVDPNKVRMFADNPAIVDAKELKLIIGTDDKKKQQEIIKSMASNRETVMPLLLAAGNRLRVEYANAMSSGDNQKIQEAQAAMAEYERKFLDINKRGKDAIDFGALSNIAMTQQISNGITTGKFLWWEEKSIPEEK